jgi:hypothetical protein
MVCELLITGEKVRRFALSLIPRRDVRWSSLVEANGLVFRKSGCGSPPVVDIPIPVSARAFISPTRRLWRGSL